MKYLRNPTTGEVKYASALEAKRFKRYGWQVCRREDWIQWQRAKVQAAMVRTIPAAKAVYGRMQ